MYYLTAGLALLASTALASPIAQQGTPAAGTPPVATPMATPMATPGSLPLCGAHAYDPRAFYCHNNKQSSSSDVNAAVAQESEDQTANVLCPIQNGRALPACGAQCYDPAIFSCEDGALSVGSATPTPAGVYPPAGATPTGAY